MGRGALKFDLISHTVNVLLERKTASFFVVDIYSMWSMSLDQWRSQNFIFEGATILYIYLLGMLRYHFYQVMSETNTFIFSTIPVFSFSCKRTTLHQISLTKTYMQCRIRF